jgi:hypothetical protein
MKIKGLFPTEYRTFTNGQLSIKVERYGNIDYIGWLEIRNFEGKNYPDRHGVHFFSRTHFQSMRMAPAINFFQEDENNQRRDFVPKNCELFPNGYVGDDSALKVKQNSFAMEFKPYSTRPFNILLRKNNVPTGQLKTLKNQIVQSWKSHCRFTSLDLKEMGISEDIPFPEDGKVEQELSSVSFDANNNVFVIELTRRDLWNTRKVYFALTGNNKSSFEEEALYWLLKVDCPALTENVKIGVGISFDKKEAISLAKSIILTKVIPETLQESNFALDFEDINGAATFANDYKKWQFAMLLGENDRECSIKAAAGKYGFFAMWDHIYPIRDFLMLGKVDIAKKALRYISTCYGVACYEWVGLHLPMVLNEILAFDEDLAFEEEIYNSLKSVYENFIKKSDEKTGLFPTRYSVGNDNSLQAGFSGEFFACCMNSWWYNSLCSMANIALDLSDLNAAKLFANQAKKVADNYLSVFYNFKDEYLRQAVTLDLTPGINVYQNTNTLGLDYTYGKDLLYKVIKNLANFQATKLYHATGHRAVPLDSEIPCEMWHSCHMNQHLGHECKLARMAGLPNEADRVMSAYLSKYLETGTAVETFNFTGCPGDQSQLSEWQTFSATGAVKGLVSGVAGIEIHRGGINYLPAFGTKYRKVYGLSIDNKVYNIDIVGEGNLGQLILNGQVLEGTLQLPIDVETKKENYLEFRRCNSTLTPLVFLQGEDIPITDFVYNNRHISFTINANRFGVLRFYAQNKPVIKTSNENDFELTWNEQEHLFLWKGTFHKNQRIEVQL